jgi:site-specific DNA-methyltransferase (adenine-specific)
MNQIVINGYNIELLKNYPDNYFHAVVTDPPYGLGKEPNAEELMKDWVEKGYHEISGKGFMGKEWDAFIPQPVFWKEVFRVLKHGGHILSFFGTRTYDWGVMSMRFAGFEVRDCIQWLYGSGFPKSHNISKALDKLEGTFIEGKESKNSRSGVDGDENGYDHSKRITLPNPQSETAKLWDGWGSALKPANEPIVLARKPLEKGLSIAENILKWGVGGINIDASRIGLTNKDIKDNGRIINRNIRESEDGWGMQDNKADRVEVLSNQGRFPANIILTHHEDCVCKGTKKVKPSNGSGKASEKGGGFSKGMFGDGTSDNIGGGFTDADGNETIEDWDCHEDCPIGILDEQSGVLKSGAMDSIAKGGKYNVYSKMTERRVTNSASVGGASRFFYVAKASKAERNKGLDGFEEKRSSAYGYEIGLGDKGEGMFKDRNPIKQNFHPTVKPIKLMQYLVKMITPPNGIVLDPFCGSGTTGVACKIEGFQFVGLEQDPEYAKIAEARITNYEPEVSITKKSKDKPNLEQIPLF